MRESAILKSQQNEKHLNRHMSKIFIQFLISQTLVVGIVSVIFSVIENRYQAGMMAGALFIMQGIWILWLGQGMPALRKRPTYIIALLQLFIFSIPMVLIRFLNSSQEFQSLNIWGLRGPIFHQISTLVYLALMIATAVDVWRSRRNDGNNGEL
jgi:hypothetical protein